MNANVIRYVSSYFLDNVRFGQEQTFHGKSVSEFGSSSLLCHVSIFKPMSPTFIILVACTREFMIVKKPLLIVFVFPPLNYVQNLPFTEVNLVLFW